jgi:hypothetical protein
VFGGNATPHHAGDNRRSQGTVCELEFVRVGRDVGLAAALCEFFDLRILRGDLLAKENNLPFQAIDMFSRRVWTCRDKSRLVGARRGCLTPTVLT